MFEGTFPAIATPFADGHLDEEALAVLARHLVDSGVDGIVACGTTGEAPTLSHEEWGRVVEICVEVCGPLPVIAGTGTNNTAVVIERTHEARRLGATGALVVTPYYNKPGPAGQIAHYEAVARETGMPIILYNVPSRTGVKMSPATIIELSQIDEIVGVKEACGSMDQFGEILAGACPGFRVFSGDDSLTFPLYALGGHGVISTTAGVAPRLMSDMYTLFRSGEIEDARRIHFRLLPLFHALFVETNPAPLKYALSVLGLARNELRLPLVPVTASTQRQVDTALASCGLV